jgi:cell division protein FtsN
MTAFRSRTIRAIARQRGSTLTGLIIGLIVGLGIAVAVALTITKGASPFTEKTAKAGRPADPAPGQAMDPNKPMYGNRDAAREANKEVTEKAAARSRPPEPAAPAAPAASADPLGAAIASMEAKPAAAPQPAARDSHPLTTAAAPAAAAPATVSAAAPAAGTGSGEYVYYLQAGAFREMSDAEATRAKLALLGFEAAISDRTSDSGVLHRVRVGPYSQVAVNKARAKLLDSGMVVDVVRTQR